MRKLKKEVKYVFYVLGVLVVVGIIYGIESTLFKVNFNTDSDYDYVNKTIFEDTIPVVNVENSIVRPYNESDIKIVKGYYDYLDDSENQVNSLIYSENTYIQSSGVSYGKNEVFDVVSILEGIVIDVKDDEMLGKVIEIRHSNDVISIYQSLSEVNYKVNDTVMQGDIIGKTGECNISKELGNHVHLELIINGTTVNPENYYGKKLSEL